MTINNFYLIQFFFLFENSIMGNRTFLRWLNSKRKLSGKPFVSDVQTGLSDGMVLIELLEDLSARKIANKYLKINSKLRQQHLERVLLVLECMRNDSIETFIEIGMMSYILSLSFVLFIQ